MFSAIPPIGLLLLAAAAPGFRPFTAAHYLTVLMCVGAILTVTAQGHRLRRRNEAHERALRRELGWGCLVVYVLYQIWLWLPQNFRWEEALPLEFCDMSLLVAAFALLTSKRWLRGLLYFWAAVFTLQAFVTPVIQKGPDTVDFWLFWVAHTCIAGAAVYDVVIGRFRPTFVDAARSYAISFLYAAALLILDVFTGWDYGYVGPVKPSTPTLIDALGEFPLRILWMTLIAAAGFIIVWLPWAVSKDKPRVTTGL